MGIVCIIRGVRMAKDVVREEMHCSPEGTAMHLQCNYCSPEGTAIVLEEFMNSLRGITRELRAIFTLIYEDSDTSLLFL